MKSSLTRWLMAGALGAGFVMGCNHSGSVMVSKAPMATTEVVKNDGGVRYGVIYHTCSTKVATAAPTLPPVVVPATAPAPVVQVSVPAAQITLPPAEVAAPQKISPPVVAPAIATSRPVP